MTNPAPTIPRLLLTVEDAAQHLAISRTTMFTLLRTGTITSIRIGRLRRIPIDALTTYITTLTPNAA